jgi:hypothetical protein
MVFMRTRSLCAIALGVMLVLSLTSVAAARYPAGVRGTNTIVSTGTGRQTLEGAGLLYGVLAPGGDVRVIDLSAGHDGRFTVTAQIPASGGAAAQSAAIKPVRIAGQLIFKPTKANAKRSLAFSVAGSKFRLVLEGASTLNGAGVSGTVKLEGQGTVSINGQNPPLEWATAGKLTLPTKAALAAAAKAAKTTSTGSATTTTKTTTATTATTATP